MGATNLHLANGSTPMDPVDAFANLEQAILQKANASHADLEQQLERTQAEFEERLASQRARTTEFEQQLATQRSHTEEIEAKRKSAEDSLAETEARLKAAGERNAENERLNQEHEARLMRAETKIAEIEEATWREFLILLGIGAVASVGGMYLQRRFNWSIPWVLLAGTASAMYAVSNKNLPKGVRYVMVGGGAGLGVGAVAFTFFNAFPGWHRSP